ncbi:type VI secretion system protein TssA [Pseudoduganella violaceinigra]|uniref:type VI secretion system protein TssA n=1 Tax=Pseudoduganella violaceinigra TaxID=246602 RepID=UPI0004202CD1|nr:type VI secretion system protein TssA [Pseudoduganella violaceinigra]
MFNAETLLAPISPAQPAGDDLSFSSDFDAIAQARRFDDPSLEQGEWVTELKEADWPFVVSRCAALLGEKSKDLRIAVWLAEAAAKQHRMQGLGESFRLLAGLIREFWDKGLYPEPDGDDMELRIGNLAWILGRTPALLREMPLTEGQGTAFSAVDFDMARKQASLPENARNADWPKLADMETARSRNSPRFREQFATDARYCMDALRELEQAADECMGNDSPGFAAARDAVQAMIDAMPSHAGLPAAAAQNGAAPAGEQVAVAQPAMGSAAMPMASGPVMSRTQAISQLREIASYFRRTEPHSPVSYFADKAADAGEQDLHTWLRSVVKDSGSLQHIEEMLGIASSN